MLIRAQGNFIEYVPLGVTTLGLVETRAAPAWIVIPFGAILVIGRVLHAFGMLTASGPVRGFGILTYLALLGAAGRLIAAVGFV
ncbi:MAPEG family protein [Mesorhizobium sp. INR15]|uniref:MAPEG family protein n=1 Tax=Mesorhizobium sp. INR15 TaxID=2654248 RepID=UPI0021562A31|nr:MAPEG family protein [Mesorhizobium sp. INR15]